MGNTVIVGEHDEDTVQQPSFKWDDRTMGEPPIAAPHTEGRVFGTDWSIAHVATLLRVNAARGRWRRSDTPGGYTASINRNYARTVSARHLPTGVTVIFMQLEAERCWYASLCFASADGYLPWSSDTAEKWLTALFDQDRPRVLETPPASSGDSGNPSVRQFTLAGINV
jgi:hypothetical protein